MAIRGTPTLSYWQKKFSNSILSIYENEIAIDENFLKVAHIPYHLFSRHEGKALIAHLARFTLDSGNFSFKDPSDLWRNCSKKSLKNSNSFFRMWNFWKQKKSWSTIWSCWTYNNYWRWKWWNNAKNKPGIYRVSTVRSFGNWNNLYYLFSKCPFNFVEISITFTSIPATRRFPLVKISISSSNIWSEILHQKKWPS